MSTKERINRRKNKNGEKEQGVKKNKHGEGYGTQAQGVSVDNRSRSAFPLADGEGHYNLGMSLRDYFAGQALAGLTAGTPLSAHLDSDDWSIKGFAKCSYQIADAMLTEREGSA